MVENIFIEYIVQLCGSEETSWCQIRQSSLKTSPPQTCSVQHSAPGVISVQAAPFQAYSSARRRLSLKAQAEEVQSEGTGSADTAGLTSQFGGNSKFASVLAGALQRSGGTDVLTTGPERIDEP